MLDNFIIEQIRKEKEDRAAVQRRLRIEMPNPDDERWIKPPKRKEESSTPERGSTIVDYSI